MTEQKAREWMLIRTRIKTSYYKLPIIIAVDGDTDIYHGEKLKTDLERENE